MRTKHSQQHKSYHTWPHTSVAEQSSTKWRQEPQARRMRCFSECGMTTFAKRMVTYVSESEVTSEKRKFHRELH